MFGWINDCTEQLVVTKFGLATWHEIKKQAGCDVKDFSFVRHEYYDDGLTVSLVVAASNVLGIPVDAVLEAFGEFFMEFVRKNGYENLLSCQGSTLRLWLSNMNALHDHLASALPPGFVKPVFWCEDCDTKKGSILLHYFSKRGSLLAPLVVGVVKEVARFHFEMKVVLERIATQDENGSEFTTWIISAVDPADSCKLTEGVDDGDAKPYATRRGTLLHSNSSHDKGTRSDGRTMTCPFSGLTFEMNAVTEEMKSEGLEVPPAEVTLKKSDVLGIYGDETSSSYFKLMDTLFPYNVIIDRDNFSILHAGTMITGILQGSTPVLAGQFIGDVLVITRPVLGGWNLSAMLKLTDQTFFIEPVSEKYESSGMKFKGSLVSLPSGNIMLVLSPDAKNVSELTKMNLTMSDLPLHSFQRDAVFLGEHIVSEVRSAHKLDKLSKRLEAEKNISNSLLHSMLPRNIADDLRAGKTFEPQHYDDVTIFFSDVVGFTSICNSVEPWDVVDMLNQLYGVMDFLANKFSCYKMGTIGDAYMAVSGIPKEDKNHAENIANFAIAVLECVKHVQSPADGKPLTLRIGIHTGSVTAGVVGTLTPSYCLFGDSVNFAAKCESSGEAGRIQCSSICYGRLKHFSQHEVEQYHFTPRGLVSMKDIGDRMTYWLDSGTSANQMVNPTTMKQLYEEVGLLVARQKWKKRRYFRRGSVHSTSSGAPTEFTSGSSKISGSTTESTSGAGSSEQYTGGFVDDEFLITDDENQSVGSQSFDEEASVSDRDIDSQREDPNSVAGEKDFEGSSHLDGTPSNKNSSVDNRMDTASLCNLSWSQLHCSVNLTHEDLINYISELLSEILLPCLVKNPSEMPDNWDIIVRQLYGFVHRISTLYKTENRFHNWRHACHVTLCASYLMEKAQEDDSETNFVDSNPWYRFTLAFAALIHDVKHVGVSNKQLIMENNVLAQIYDGGSCLERQSINVARSVFLEEFPELSVVILQGNPLFMRHIHSITLSTDIMCKEVQLDSKDKFVRSVENRNVENDNDLRIIRTEATMEQLMLLADVGHCAQQYETFLRWNRAFYEECLLAYFDRRGFDPRSGWYAGQISFISDYVLPLAERCDKLTLRRCGLKEGVEMNLLRWKVEGEAWTDRMVEETTPESLGVNSDF